MKEAYVIITTALGLEQQILNEIKTFPEVQEIHIILGVYDLILRVKSNTLEELNDAVGHIRRNRNVRGLLKLIVEETG